MMDLNNYLLSKKLEHDYSEKIALHAFDAKEMPS